MSLGFRPAAKHGQHYDLAVFAAHQLKSVNLLMNGKSERQFEMTVVSHLQASPPLNKNLITQIDIDEVKKITQASLFGFSHRPDISIGNDGTAIEIKVISSGAAVRDVLGQALAYRMHYRFAILVLIDATEERQVVSSCRTEGSRERSLLLELAAAMNIFTIIGPLSKSRNIVFAGERQGKDTDKNVESALGQITETSGVKQGRAEDGAALDPGQEAILTLNASHQATGPGK